MQEYTYHFADGTKKTVWIEDGLYHILNSMDRSARQADAKYYERHKPFWMIKFLEMDWDEDERLILEEELNSTSMSTEMQVALSRLTPKQRELIEKIYYEQKSVEEIAKEQGVPRIAIADRLSRIQKKLKRVLKEI